MKLLPVCFFFYTIAIPILTASVASASNELYIVEAGKNGRFGPRLVDGLTFCPADFSARGFSILCLPSTTDASASASARGVSFILNGSVAKVEWKIPYALNGDADGVIFPWNSYRIGRTSIGCFINNEGGALISVNFECPHSVSPGTPAHPSPVYTPSVAAVRRNSPHHSDPPKPSSVPSPTPISTPTVSTKTPEPASARATQSRAVLSSASPRPSHLTKSSSRCTHTTSRSQAASHGAPTATWTPTPTINPPPSHPSLLHAKSGHDSPSYLPFSFPQLGIVKSEQPENEILVLRNGFTFCPTSFGPFTVICKNNRASSVSFEVNGRILRTDTAAPFTINEEVNGGVASWNAYQMGRITITAVTNTGMRTDVHGRFDCPILVERPRKLE